MLKSKINFKFLLALGIMLIAVFILNMGTVNAATNQEAEDLLNEIPSEINVNATVKEEIDNIIENEYNLDVSKIVETITLPEEYTFNICFENANNINFGTAWLTSSTSGGKSVTDRKFITVHYKDEVNKNATDEQIATDIITGLENTEFTFKYTGELTNGKLPDNIEEKQNQTLLSDIKTKFDLDNKNAEAKIFLSYELGEDTTCYYIGIFIKDVYYGCATGISQKIVIDNSTTDIVTATDNTTNIKLEADTSVVPSNTVLEVSTITEGTTYNAVKTVLSDVNNFKVYDITLKSNGVAIQPNGKVKISIPVPNDFDKSNLVVYRIAEDGTKTEYAVTINGDVATFETDHFSTYVLAEKETETVAETPAEAPTTNNREKDDTPKTGTIDMIYFILPVAIISAVGIVVFKRKETK